VSTGVSGEEAGGQCGRRGLSQDESSGT
jgi:hypothetical protein